MKCSRSSTEGSKCYEYPSAMDDMNNSGSCAKGYIRCEQLRVVNGMNDSES